MSKRTLVFALLFSIAAGFAPWRPLCRADAKPYSSDQPAEESKDQSESFDESSSKHSDDLESAGLCDSSHHWNAHAYVPLDLDAHFFLRIVLRGPGHCRAPPTALL